LDFSIIVPTYNAEKYLKECLDSIFSQKHDGKTQVIVVDGLSTDKTLEIVKSYNVELICGKDKNEPDALNKGFLLAEGDIVAFLDADDIYQSDTFWIVEHFFDTYKGTKWVYGKSYFINEQGNKIRRIITNLKQILQTRYSYEKLCSLCFISQPSVFMRREFQKEIGDFNIDYPLIFDYEYWLRVGKISEPIYINTYLSSMRVHNGSNSVKFSMRQMRESLDLVYRFKKKHFYWNYLIRLSILFSTIIYYRTIGKII
jgi:glycosyltransferase involved in cell wall biosynthesis